MAMPSAISKSEHDHIVRQEALKCLAQGYAVKARVEDWFEPPEVINGYRPDIIAIGNGIMLIVEVKKGPVDWPKIFALQQFEKSNPAYRLVIVPAGPQQR